MIKWFIFLTKTTAAQNEAELSYRKVRGLYFLAVAFVGTVDIKISLLSSAPIILYKSCYNALHSTIAPTQVDGGAA